MGGGVYENINHFSIYIPVLTLDQCSSLEVMGELSTVFNLNYYTGGKNQVGGGGALSLAFYGPVLGVMATDQSKPRVLKWLGGGQMKI